MNGIIAAFQNFIAGKKTYIVALVTVAIAIATSQGIVIPDWLYTLLAGLGLAGVRAALPTTTQK
jgi:small-conductance mechanosensitive channel